MVHLTAAQRIEAEIEQEEYECHYDKSRSKKRLMELKKELAQAIRNDEIMAEDPMTSWIGF